MSKEPLTLTERQSIAVSTRLALRPLASSLVPIQVISTHQLLVPLLHACRRRPLAVRRSACMCRHGPAAV